MVFFFQPDFDYDYDYGDGNDYDYFESWALFKQSDFYDTMNQRAVGSWNIFHTIEVQTNGYNYILLFVMDTNNNMDIFVYLLKLSENQIIVTTKMIHFQLGIFVRIDTISD